MHYADRNDVKELRKYGKHFPKTVVEKKNGLSKSFTANYGKEDEEEESET